MSEVPLYVSHGGLQLCLKQSTCPEKMKFQAIPATISVTEFRGPFIPPGIRFDPLGFLRMPFGRSVSVTGH